MKTKTRLVLVFAATVLLVAFGLSNVEAACSCAPTTPSCSNCGTLAITTAAASGGNTSCRGNGADCTDVGPPCAASDTLDGTAIVSWTAAPNPGGCGCTGYTEQFVICDAWVDCDSNITICGQCTTWSIACNASGSTMVINNGCSTAGSGASSGDRWQHVITVKDVTGTACPSTCAGGGCTSGCTPVCSITARSCCLSVP